MTSVVNPTVFQFTPPALFTDGTAIPAGEIAKFQYGIGTATGVYGTPIDDASLTLNAQGKKTAAVPVLPVGNYFAACRTLTKDGGVSAWGNELPFAVAARIPAAVSDFSAS